MAKLNAETAKLKTEAICNYLEMNEKLNPVSTVLVKLARAFVESDPKWALTKAESAEYINSLHTKEYCPVV